MATPITDTHAFYKRLTQAGMTPEQAEVFAANQADINGELVDINRKLELMGRDLTIRFGAMVIGSAVTIIGFILGVLPHLLK